MMLRNYGMEDIVMHERSQLFCNMFREDETAFRAAFPKFTATYADDFQQAIDDADALPFDSEVVESIAVLTENIVNKAADSNIALRRFYGYAKIGFEDDRSMLAKLGYGDWAKARQNPPKLEELLDFVHRRAEESDVKSVLLGIGYTQAEIDGLETLRAGLDMLIKNKEDAKAKRYELTAQRITTFNKVWTFTREVSEASRVVFADSPAKLQSYRLYGGRKSKRKEEKSADIVSESN
jgi:hypothetical protein